MRTTCAAATTNARLNSIHRESQTKNKQNHESVYNILHLGQWNEIFRIAALGLLLHTCTPIPVSLPYPSPRPPPFSCFPFPISFSFSRSLAHLLSPMGSFLLRRRPYPTSTGNIAPLNENTAAVTHHPSFDRTFRSFCRSIHDWLWFACHPDTCRFTSKPPTHGITHSSPTRAHNAAAVVRDTTRMPNSPPLRARFASHRLRLACKHTSAAVPASRDHAPRVAVAPHHGAPPAPLGIH